jgi:SRSO17 transposase
MTPEQMRKLDTELREYFESMVEGMGRLERRHALEMYLTGLLLDGERKSVEPMAGRLVEEPAKREAVRQRLQQCVSVADWSDEEMRRRLAMKLEAELPQLEALVVDDTGFAKKGEYSVGVARQYSGTLGRTDNCLPEEWTRSRKRCKPANTPLKKLVRLAKLRWRVERDYQQLKGEVGLDHFEGRTWRGFHHHATLCMVAHGFLAVRRALFPPEEEALDPFRGAPPTSALAAAPHRPLPTLPAARRSPRTSSRAVANLIR